MTELIDNSKFNSFHCIPNFQNKICLLMTHRPPCCLSESTEEADRPPRRSCALAHLRTRHRALTLPRSRYTGFMVACLTPNQIHPLAERGGIGSRPDRTHNEAVPYLLNYVQYITQTSTFQYRQYNENELINIIV